MNIGVGGGGEYREIRLTENRLYPFNSDQEHGPGNEPGELACRAFMVDRTLIQEAASAAGINKTVESEYTSCPPPPVCGGGSRAPGRKRVHA